MKKIYIAGPMTGIEDYNFSLFDKVSTQLWKDGYKVLSPAFRSRELGISNTYETFLREALKILLECDEIMMLPGWQESFGSSLEHQIAVALGMTIHYYE